MSVSTHVLDAATGRPAAGLGVRLDVAAGDGSGDGDDHGADRDATGSPPWTTIGGGSTDADGRLRDLTGRPGTTGSHRLVFATGAWFAERGRPTFYPEVVVVFAVTDAAADHHVPLLLSPYAYSTYRGT